MLYTNKIKINLRKCPIDYRNCIDILYFQIDIGLAISGFYSKTLIRNVNNIESQSL